jgi:hypothetical protein
MDFFALKCVPFFNSIRFVSEYNKKGSKDKGRKKESSTKTNKKNRKKKIQGKAREYRA